MRTRTVMVSLIGRTLRVHEGYADAPDDVLRAIVTFATSRTRAARAAAKEIILAYDVERAPAIRRVERARPGDVAIGREPAGGASGAQRPLVRGQAAAGGASRFGTNGVAPRPLRSGIAVHAARDCALPNPCREAWMARSAAYACSTRWCISGSTRQAPRSITALDSAASAGRWASPRPRAATSSRWRNGSADAPDRPILGPIQAEFADFRREGHRRSLLRCNVCLQRVHLQ